MVKGHYYIKDEEISNFQRMPNSQFSMFISEAGLLRSLELAETAGEARRRLCEEQTTKQSSFNF